MRVLPVLDLCRGQVVHARAGVRENYQPLKSAWTDCAHDPWQLTEAFRQRLNVEEWYVADLDALGGGQPQYSIISRLMAGGLRLWLDAGVRTSAEATHWVTANVHRLIIAGESLPSLDLLRELTARFGPDRIAFSLDLFHGKVKSPPRVLPEAPLDALDAVAPTGIAQVIILDTAAVGVCSGPATGPLCEVVRRRHPELKLITGGGVRHSQDLNLLREYGVDIALVATALHADTCRAAEMLMYRAVPRAESG